MLIKIQKHQKTYVQCDEETNTENRSLLEIFKTSIRSKIKTIASILLGLSGTHNERSGETIMIMIDGWWWYGRLPQGFPECVCVQTTMWVYPKSKHPKFRFVIILPSKVVVLGCYPISGQIYLFRVMDISMPNFDSQMTPKKRERERGTTKNNKSVAIPTQNLLGQHWILS